MVRSLDGTQRSVQEQNLMAMFSDGGDFSHRKADCPVLSHVKGTKNTWEMSNHSWFWSRDQRARAVLFTVWLWLMTSTPLPGTVRRQRSAWWGSAAIPHSSRPTFPWQMLPCPRAFPGGKVRVPPVCRAAAPRRSGVGREPHRTARAGRAVRCRGGARQRS